ncbi:MAG: hemerythrin domain-containing protein [Gammaproteobacteria bacterium]|jgi:hemerythrin-like domain-containing protein
MGDMLDTLREDHVNLSKLLVLLSDQLATLQAGDTPDYNLMRDIVDYIDNYPDLVHHPREDVMFEVYLEHHRKQRKEINELMEEHKLLPELTDRLLESIDAILSDAIQEREAFETRLYDYIQIQRRHLDTEEATVFPTIRAALKEDDWRRIEAEVPHRHDPLFGDILEKQYADLYERIRASD